MKNIPQKIPVHNHYDFRFSFSEGFKRTFLSILATILFTILIFYLSRHYLSSDTAFGKQVAKEFFKENEALVKSKIKSENIAPVRKRKAKKVDKPVLKKEKTTEEELLELLDEPNADSQ